MSGLGFRGPKAGFKWSSPGRSVSGLMVVVTLGMTPLMAQEEKSRGAGAPGEQALEQDASLLAPVPARSVSGQTLEILDSELDQGMPFYVLSGEDTQFVVRSQAPLQSLVAVSSRAVGYFVAPFDVEEIQPADGDTAASPLLSGALRIPVASLTTGASAADRLVKTQLLAASEFPEIGFVLTAVSDVQRLDEAPAATGAEGVAEAPTASPRFSLSAHGQLEVRGLSVPFTLPLEMTFHGATNQTMDRFVGQLAEIRGSFELPLETLGIQVPPQLAARIAPAVTVDFYLMLANISPDRPLVPLTPVEQHVAESQFLTQLRDLQNGNHAYRQGAEYLKSVWDDAEALNRMAFIVLAEEGVQDRRPAFALRAAERAVELTERSDALKLNTLARAQFEVGEVEKAVATQKELLAKAGEDPRTVAQLRRNLERYESAIE